jgi:hypothetical protein
MGNVTFLFILFKEEKPNTGSLAACRLAAMVIMADRKKLLVHVKNYSKWKSFCF